jgi:hypothetical protein
MEISLLAARICFGLRARVHSMHVLWKIFGASFELLAHNHVEVGAQVFSFGGWRSIKSLSETLSINNCLVIGLASIIL